MNLFFKFLFFLGFSSFLFPMQSFAEKSGGLPIEPKNSLGSATYSYEKDNLKIYQHSDKIVTDWSEFNIHNGKSVEFIQPTNSSSALNRVHSSDMSVIEGQLTSNGNVILINPHGVLFKGGSRVEVGSLIISALNIKNENFFKELFVFEGEHQKSEISNKGIISASETGNIVLIGSKVSNYGNINLRNGSVALISGKKVRLVYEGNKLVSFDVNEKALNSIVQNEGKIINEGGLVFLSADSQNLLVDSVVNNAGKISANSIEKKGGKIFLSAKGGEILNSGQVSANSKNNKGGHLQLEASKIKVGDGSEITATGYLDGGNIIIGGSWQNSNKNVFQAEENYISGAYIDASSTSMGSGGKIVIWSDIKNKRSKTNISGKIYSQGGDLSGNGGYIETSGYDLNIGPIDVSTSSQNGEAGLWLLDPYDIVIGASGGTDYMANSSDETISATSLANALNSTNVTIQTGGVDSDGAQSGNITLSSDLSWNTSSSLSLNAHNNIFLNSNIVMSGTGGSMILRPNGGNIGGTGTISLSNSSTLSLAHGSDISNNILLVGNANVGLASPLLEYLVVGAGGGGGFADRYAAGGGGGGEVVSGSLVLNADQTSVIVGSGGAGGSGSANNATIGGIGSSSSFGSISASGGGGGASGYNPQTGASSGYTGGGGGAQATYRSGSSGASGTKYSGGNGFQSGDALTQAGGGGGGAGGAGNGATASNAGQGGQGISSQITGSTVFYGGGGGGGVRNSGSTIGAGQHGGGSGGSDASNAVHGTANSGGGGGGAGSHSGIKTGGDGAGGVVFVRYLGSGDVATGGNTETTVGNFTLHTFNSSGTFTYDHSKGLATISGNISGIGELSKIELGTIRLDGTNSYTGGSDIVSGSLIGNLSTATTDTSSGSSTTANQSNNSNNDVVRSLSIIERYTNIRSNIKFNGVTLESSNLENDKKSTDEKETIPVCSKANHEFNSTSFVIKKCSVSSM